MPSLPQNPSPNLSSNEAKLVLRRVGFVIKHHQPEAASFALELARYLINEDLSVAFAKESAPVGQLLRKGLI